MLERLAAWLAFKRAAKTLDNALQRAMATDTAEAYATLADASERFQDARRRLELS